MCVHSEGALEPLERVVTLSWDVGPPGSLRGFLKVNVDHQVNGGRSTRWENAMKRLRARFRFGKWITGRREFTCLRLEQQPDFSKVESQEACATGVKQAKMRRTARPDDCATPFETNPRDTWRRGHHWMHVG